MSAYSGRLAVQQRVLPNYRVAFFDELAGRCQAGLALFSGDPLPREIIPSGEAPVKAEYTPGRNKHIFYPGHFLYTCDQPDLLNWLTAADPDALIIEANPRYPKNLEAIEWMHRRGKPVLGWGLGVPPGGGFWSAMFGRMRGRMLGALDGMIAYSRQGAEEYARTGLLKPETIFVAHNAVAGPPDQPPAAPGSKDGPLNVLFVGRLQKRKRLDLLLAGCANVPGQLRPIVTIVGDGPDRLFFEKLAEELPVEAKFTGALHGEPLAEQFRNADLFVLPGTGGLAVQEAMSWGLPVIVAQGDGTQADLVRPENGWLVPPGDPDSLQAALAEALSDRPALAGKGAESRRIAVEEINIVTMADRFVEALQAVPKPG